MLADLYALLLETMPPPDGFDIADKVKANFDPAKTTIAPERSRETWMWFHTEVVDALRTPMLLDRFLPHLTSAYRALFGPDLAQDALRLRRYAISRSPDVAAAGLLAPATPGYEDRHADGRDLLPSR